MLKNFREYVIMNYQMGSFREIIKNVPQNLLPRDNKKVMDTIKEGYDLYMELKKEINFGRENHYFPDEFKPTILKGISHAKNNLTK